MISQNGWGSDDDDKKLIVNGTPFSNINFVGKAVGLSALVARDKMFDTNDQIIQKISRLPLGLMLHIILLNAY